MYNVRIKNYGNGQVQTAIYSHPVYTGKKAEYESTKEFETNPFNNEKTLVIDDFDYFEKEHERSVLNSMKRSKNKIYDLTRANIWDWFVTLTLNPEKVNRYDYSDCTKKVSQWLKNMQKDCGLDFKYVVVPERHKDGAYHFHGLFSQCGNLDFVFSGHYDKQKREIYNIGKYKLGWATATKVSNNQAATKYMTKYVTKDLMEHTKNKKKYWASRNLNVPTEYTEMLDLSDARLLHEELVSFSDIQHYKSIGYEVGTARRNVSYYETIEE
ncbi:hypothetical protein GKG47_20125 [Lactonifactor sp. BIOML-A3]|uniref:rolling circle replication-associated protein n=1 Tax=unclassified Lactonifactor TaxID=2636670 RepID=UPI0012AF5239|nr:MULTISPECIES: hypothetical protein [unclassified Lactonifactor]MSA03714.1 hypothetical protein [Lactonifactor sp. BIOML-A5]MSA10171.1 hypothetical protein [Lactonifactor sp. BIOML-A4]MSA14721.1 hypothetical protein [Lactonifactor sp. BIOML-A3]MSA19143.1 hypothetical protein [Lactonifactor sp. BIOML-A2]MSA39817.1 hypothetical protein [Lactonifactor sp. BIOML-A1]